MSSILESASEAASSATRRMSTILSPAYVVSDGTNLMNNLTMEVDSDEESEDDDDYLDNEDEELDGGAQDAPGHEGPMMLKDWGNDGEWVPCFCILRHEMFLVYASEGDDERQDLDLLETCGVRGMTSVHLGDDGILTIQSNVAKSNKSFVLCGPRMEVWLNYLEEAINLYGQASVVKEGWLLKRPSHGVSGADTWKLGGGLKERYMRLSAHELRYYRGDGADEPVLGSLRLLSVEAVSMVCDAGDTCTREGSDDAAAMETGERGEEGAAASVMFEVVTSSRVVTFHAANPSEARGWVTVLEKAKTTAHDTEQEMRRLHYEQEIDDRIQLYDKEGLIALHERVDTDLAAVYPSRFELAVVPGTGGGEGDGCDPFGEESAPVRAAPTGITDHLECADSVMMYLSSFMDAVQKNDAGQDEARYDALAPFLIRINDFLSRRMLPFISDPDSDEMLKASSSDVYALIKWVTKYQNLLRLIYCPVDGTREEGCFEDGQSRGSISQSSSPRSGSTTTYCRIFDEIPDLCQRYVDGNDRQPMGADGQGFSTYGRAGGDDSGTGSHLVNTILTLWENTLKRPQDTLQQHHQDGTFFTQNPVDVWRTLRQHISLASHSQSPVLHVMVVDKIAIALTHLIESIIGWVECGFDAMIKEEEKEREDKEKEYVRMQQEAVDNGVSYPPGQAPWQKQEREDKSKGAGLLDVQLEFLCALANDNAIHIEEVYDVIDGVESLIGLGGTDITSRVEEAFDPVTTGLVKCGNVCLKRLAGIVLADVEDHLNEVMTDKWFHADEEEEGGSEDESGNQMQVAIVTTEDYLNDLLQFLNPFWSRKVKEVVFETLTIRYCRSLLFYTPPNGAPGSPGRGSQSYSPIPQRSVDGSGVFNTEEYMTRQALDGDEDEEEDEEEQQRSHSTPVNKDVDRTSDFTRRMSVHMTRMGSMLNDAASTMSAAAENWTAENAKANSYTNNRGGKSPAIEDDDEDAVTVSSRGMASGAGGRRESIAAFFAGDMKAMVAGAIESDCKGADDSVRLLPTPEILGHVARDVNQLNVFFTKHAGQAISGEFLGMLNEVMTLLALPAEEIAKHSVNMIVEHPLAAISVRETALACMRSRLRVDLEKGDVEEALYRIEMILVGAEEAAEKNEDAGIDEGKKGLLFIELVEGAIAAHCLADHHQLDANGIGTNRRARSGSVNNVFGTSHTNSLAQRQKEKANVNLSFLRDGASGNSKSGKGGSTTGVDLDKARAEALDGETEGLMDEVVAAMAENEKRRQALAALEDAEIKRAGQMLGGGFSGRMHVKGYLERKPPSAPSWTKNWFTLQSRRHARAEGEDSHELDDFGEKRVYTYQVKWATSRPPCPASHVFSVESIATVSLLQVPAEEFLVYIEETGEAALLEEVAEKNHQENLQCYLESGIASWENEDIDDNEDCYPLRVHPYARSEEFDDTSVSADHLVFCLRMYDGAKHLLRTRKVLKGVHWINSFAKAAHLAYEKESQEWNRETRITLNVKLRQRQAESTNSGSGDGGSVNKKDKFRRRRSVLSPVVSPSTTTRSGGSSDSSTQSPLTQPSTTPNIKAVFKKPTGSTPASAAAARHDNKMPSGPSDNSSATKELRGSDLADAIASAAFDEDVEEGGSDSGDDAAGPEGAGAELTRDTIPAQAQPMDERAVPVLDMIANMPSDVKPESRPQPELLTREILSTRTDQRDMLGSGESSVSSPRNSLGVAPGYYNRRASNIAPGRGVQRTQETARRDNRPTKQGPSHQGADGFMALAVETLCFCFLLDEEEEYQMRKQERGKNRVGTVQTTTINPMNDRG